MFIIIFVSHTLSWCQRVVGFSRNWENLTAIELNNNKSDTLSWCQISGKIQEAFQEDLKYSDFF